jgi:Fic family protein
MNDFREIDEMKAKLDAHRPIDPKAIRAVQEKFQLEWTYHSNALEGNPLSLSETSFFIREGLTSRGKPLFAYLEAKNHITALGFLERMVTDNTELTEHLIKQYHAMLFDKIDYVDTPEGRVRIEGGRYKTENNHVIRLDGQIHNFTDALQVTCEMEKLLEWYKGEKLRLHPIELAALMHHRLVAIHPFTDGNGRVSRLVMNTVLMQAGYTPAIIPVEEKRAYLEALQSADDGRVDAFTSMIEQLVARTLRLTLDVVEGREAFDFDDLSKMFLNIVEKTKAIEQSLGAAVQTPEARSQDTATKLRELIKGLVTDHLRKINSPDCPVSFFENIAFTPGMQQALVGLQGSSANTPVGLQINSQKRTVPELKFLLMVRWMRTQITIAGLTEIGKLGQAPAYSLMKVDGSIFFEDWDLETVRAFVLQMLKNGYREWGLEAERRSEIIAREEAELEKLRPARGGQPD